MKKSRLRYLPQWTATLATHVAAWASSRPLIARTADTLPPPLLLMALHGEGILRSRFYRWAESTPLAAAPEHILSLWSVLWEDGAELLYLCENIGLAQIASRQIAIPVPDWPVQRSLYAAFIHALTDEERHDLLQLATDKVFALALARQFPALSSLPERVTLSTLQQRAHTHFQKSLALPVKLREHFTTDKDAAHFTLRVAVDKGIWQDVLDCHGPRLKPLKMQAYQAALDMGAESLRARLLNPSNSISA